MMFGFLARRQVADSRRQVRMDRMGGLNSENWDLNMKFDGV